MNRDVRIEDLIIDNHVLMAECDAAVETESVEDDDIMSEISETPTLDTDIIDELYGEARETIQQ